MDWGLHGPWFPIASSIAVVWVTILVARRYVPGPQTKRAFNAELDDVYPLAIGVVGMVISGLLNEHASVWSYFIDLGAFIVGASLVATSLPKMWPRRVGLLILGIHFAQVLVTNDNAPLNAVLAAMRW